jgi:A/G-specific adenine glycosylase
VLRDSDEPTAKDILDVAWPDAEQRERALSSLVEDGLVVVDQPRAYRLPG